MKKVLEMDSKFEVEPTCPCKVLFTKNGNGAVSKIKFHLLRQPRFHDFIL